MFPRRTASRSGSAPRWSTHLVMAMTLGAGLVAVTPSTAHAGTVTEEDAVKDMARRPLEKVEFKDAPRYRLNDIESTRLTHNADRVGVKISLRQLTKDEELTWYVGVDPSEGASREATLSAMKGSWSGEMRVVDPETDETVECGRHDIDYKADVVRISLPRDCVGEGSWVRFTVGSVSTTSKAMFGDDAMRDRPLQDGDTAWALSRRVHQ